MNADELVKACLSSVPKALAAGVVDMGTGMLVSIKTAESHPQAVIDVLSAATKEMFEGEMVVTIEDLFKQARGVDSDERYFQEIIISSTHLWHYFGRIKVNPTAVLCVVCRADINLGMMVMKARELRDRATL